MKWPMWFSRLVAEPVPVSSDAQRSAKVVVTRQRPGIRDVGRCEVCGRSMQARTRRAEFRGRVDCDCGTRNHVDFHNVRSGSGNVQENYVTVTTGRRFESAVHKPDLRLEWRFGICGSCDTAVSLLDAHVIGHEEDGGTETYAYFCNACHVHDDLRRGRLIGHDGLQVIDTLRFQPQASVR